jgi:hypothetical protein
MRHRIESIERRRVVSIDAYHCQQRDRLSLLATSYLPSMLLLMLQRSFCGITSSTEGWSDELQGLYVSGSEPTKCVLTDLDVSDSFTRFTASLPPSSRRYQVNRGRRS